MNPLTLLIIAGFVCVGILVVAICFEMYKGGRTRYAPAAAAPVLGNHSLRKVAKIMVKAVRYVPYLMHILVNESPPFNDKKQLKRYMSYINNAAVINYIQDVKGESKYA